MNRFEVSWASLWRIFFMAALVSALFLAREALIVLFVAIIISSALDGIVSWLQRKRIPRILGTIFIFLTVLVAFSLLLYAIVPTIIFELQNFLKNVSRIELPVIGQFDVSQLVNLDKYINSLGSLVSVIFNGSGSFMGFATAAFGNLAMVIMVFVISFYLTINQYGVENFLRAVLPVVNEEQVVKIYLRVRKKLGFWFQGQIVIMLLVGAMTFFGLWTLGVKYALLIAIFTGLLEILPVVGPLLAGVIAFATILPQSWVLALYSIIVFVVVQQIENHILVPLVMKKAVGISPVVVILSLLAGAQIAGFIGAILAVPVAVVFQEIILDWERRKMRAGKLTIS
ncbi:MAG: AI-2E family transporter [Candidatus Paceibacterota bacterium]